MGKTQEENGKMISTGIVLAAGSGKRMNSAVQKQFLEVGGRPLIYYALKAFQDSGIDRVVLVTGAESLEYCRRGVVERFSLTKVVSVVAGGDERYHSVYHGLEAAAGSDYVLIHDGARPMVTPEQINELIGAVQQENACVSGMPVKDTIKITDSGDYVVSTPDRRSLWLTHTPQAFAYPLILGAHEAFRADGCPDGITDDGMLVERYGNCPVKMIRGSYDNVKVTTPEDLPLVEILLRARERETSGKER